MSAGTQLPVGYIVEYVGRQPLTAEQQQRQGFTLCDGRRLNTDTYPALYNIIGTAYGGPRWRSLLPRRLRGLLEHHPATRPRWYRVPSFANGTPSYLTLDGPAPCIHHYIHHYIHHGHNDGRPQTRRRPAGRPGERCYKWS